MLSPARRPRGARSSLCAILALAAVACSRGAHTAARTPPSADELWSLAPAGTRQALVVTGPALEMFLATGRLAREGVRRDARLTTELSWATTVGGIDLLAVNLAHDSGIDPSRGAALFDTGGGVIAIVAVSNDAAFRKARGDVACRAVRGFTACARRPDVLDAVGQDATLARAAATRSPELRGGAEALVDLGDGRQAALAFTVARGELELRVHAQVPLPAMAALEPSPLAEAVHASPAAGVGLLDLRAARSIVAAQLPAESRLRPLLDALRGDAVGVALTGAPARGWLRLGVADPDATRRLLDHCDQLERRPALIATPREGGCDVVAPGFDLHVRVRLDGDTVLAESATGAADAVGTPAPAILALLAEKWQLATWARGVPATPAHINREGSWNAWVAGHVDELGIAARVRGDGVDGWVRIGTVFRNPDDVLAALEPLLTRQQRGEDIQAALHQLAGRYPRSPIAETVATGSAGLTAPAYLAGMIAPYVIMPFMARPRAPRPPAVPSVATGTLEQR